MKNLLFISGLLFAFSLSSQTIDDIYKESTLRLMEQKQTYPQEKLHLHTDRACYFPGDTIWYKAYLVDASSHIPSVESRYVYVELINKQDSILSTIMIRPDEEKGYQGYLPLPEDIRGGEYNLRAYTTYMRNEEDYFFQKPFRIISGEDFINSTNKAKAAADYAVSFFPEGGQIPAGCRGKMAFKSMGEDGVSEDIHGVILENESDTVAVFESSHRGMGVFSFVPKAGSKYEAICLNAVGIEKRYSLPEAVTDNYSLSVIHSRSRLSISLLQPQGENKKKELYLLIHTRGNMQYATRWDYTKDQLLLSTNEFDSGVSQILLVDSSFQIISERLIFCLNEDLLETCLSVDHLQEGDKSTLTLDIDLNQRLAGEVSVTVRSNKFHQIDSAFTILSDLLLSSELRGRIEEPSYYFQKGNTHATNAADLLMLTQGWRRYDVQRTLRKEYQKPIYTFERSQTIQGIVEGGYFKKGPLKDQNILLLIPDYEFSDVAISDPSGNFIFSGFEFPDSTLFYLQALNKKSNLEERIMIKREEPVSPPACFMRMSPLQAKEKADYQNYFMSPAFQQYTKEIFREVRLDEIAVTAPKLSPPKKRMAVYERMADVTFSRERIEKIYPLLTEDIVQKLPSIRIRKDTIFPLVQYRPDPMAQYRSGECAIFVDDIEQPGDFNINSIPVEWIESVSLLSGPKAFLLAGKANAAVLIYTKENSEINKRQTNKGFNHFSPLGYQKPVEFYSPVYQVMDPEKIIWDITLYWNPSVQLSETGKTSIRVELPAIIFPLYIEIEGMTVEGDIIRITQEE